MELMEFMLPCGVLTKALHIIFQTRIRQSILRLSLNTPGWRPQWEIHYLPIRLQSTPAPRLTQC